MVRSRSRAGDLLYTLQGSSACPSGASPRRQIAEFSATQSFGAVDDARRDEDDELVSRVARTATLEENPQDGDVAEERHLVQVGARVSRVDAADDRGVTVHDEKVGLGLA